MSPKNMFFFSVLPLMLATQISARALQLHRASPTKRASLAICENASAQNDAVLLGVGISANVGAQDANTVACALPINSIALCYDPISMICQFACESGYSLSTSGNDCIRSRFSNAFQSAIPRSIDPKISADEAEALASCKYGEAICGVYGGKRRAYDCVDIANDLESCGGCTIFSRAFAKMDKPTVRGVDCSAIEGVSKVSCKNRLCAVEKCIPGFSVSLDGQTCTKNAMRDSLISVKKSGGTLPSADIIQDNVENTLRVKDSPINKNIFSNLLEKVSSTERTATAGSGRPRFGGTDVLPSLAKGDLAISSASNISSDVKELSDITQSSSDGSTPSKPHNTEDVQYAPPFPSFNRRDTIDVGVTTSTSGPSTESAGMVIDVNSLDKAVCKEGEGLLSGLGDTVGNAVDSLGASATSSVNKSSNLTKSKQTIAGGQTLTGAGDEELHPAVTYRSGSGSVNSQVSAGGSSVTDGSASGGDASSNPNLVLSTLFASGPSLTNSIVNKHLGTTDLLAGSLPNPPNPPTNSGSLPIGVAHAVRPLTPSSRPITGNVNGNTNTMESEDANTTNSDGVTYGGFPATDSQGSILGDNTSSSESRAGTTSGNGGDAPGSALDALGDVGNLASTLTRLFPAATVISSDHQQVGSTGSTPTADSTTGVGTSVTSSTTSSQGSSNGPLNIAAVVSSKVDLGGNGATLLNAPGSSSPQNTGQDDSYVSTVYGNGPDNGASIPESTEGVVYGNTNSSTGNNAGNTPTNQAQTGPSPAFKILSSSVHDIDSAASTTGEDAVSATNAELAKAAYETNQRVNGSGDKVNEELKNEGGRIDEGLKAGTKAGDNAVKGIEGSKVDMSAQAKLGNGGGTGDQATVNHNQSSTSPPQNSGEAIPLGVLLEGDSAKATTNQHVDGQSSEQVNANEGVQPSGNTGLLGGLVSDGHSGAQTQPPHQLQEITGTNTNEASSGSGANVPVGLLGNDDSGVQTQTHTQAQSQVEEQTSVSQSGEGSSDANVLSDLAGSELASGSSSVDEDARGRTSGPTATSGRTNAGNVTGLGLHEGGHADTGVNGAAQGQGGAPVPSSSSGSSSQSIKSSAEAQADVDAHPRR